MTTAEPRNGRSALRPRVRSPRVRSPRATAPPSRTCPEAWQVGYRRRLVVTDVLLVLVACATVLALRGSLLAAPASPGASLVQGAVVAAVVVGWPVVIAWSGGYDLRALGRGSTEFRRLVDATVRVVAAAAVVSLLLPAPGVPAVVLTVSALGLALLALGRCAWRGWLDRERSRGGCLTTVLAVGSRQQVLRLVEELHDGRSGLRVVAACAPDAVADEVPDLGVPVLGGPEEAALVARRTGAQTVVVCGAQSMPAGTVRQLGWALEPLGVGLVMAAELEGVTSPRISVVPERSVSLLHVATPRFAGPKYAVKSTIDWIGALALTILVLPVLVVVAVVVAASSRGPILYPQERVGRDGKMFRMLKFRTMRVGADAEDHLQGPNDADGLLFKRHDDPRVTRPGKFLRRYSLDELPQLFNVLGGQMSLVGPRPPLPHEAAKYEEHVRRRLRVKPGMTGLWQISGRSDLPWDEAVRLDIYYAENWTPLGDLLILARTTKAVVTADGAY